MKRYQSPVLIAVAAFAFIAGPALAEKTAEKNAWTLSFPESKERFVKVQMEWAKKDPNWKPTREALEAKFDQLDTDKDGKLSEEEWNNRNNPKAKKEKKKKN